MALVLTISWVYWTLYIHTDQLYIGSALPLVVHITDLSKYKIKSVLLIQQDLFFNQITNT